MGDSSQATAAAGAIHFVIDEDHGSVQGIVAGGRRVVDGTRRCHRSYLIESWKVKLGGCNKAMNWPYRPLAI